MERLIIVHLISIVQFWLEIKQHIMSCCSIPCFTVVIRKETVGDMRFKDVLKEDYVFWLTL